MQTQGPEVKVKGRAGLFQGFADLVSWAMPLKIAGTFERWYAALLALGGGIALATGFLPTTKSLADWAGLSHGQSVAFPLLALFFFLSLPGRRPVVKRLTVHECLMTVWLPTAVSFAYGRARGLPPFWDFWSTPAGRESLIWFFVAVPVGEELLFRGWLQGLAERLFPEVRLTETNPLPISVWISAVAFSLWHGQNARVETLGVVGFQMAYTLLTGLWLAYLRWASGRILPCIIGHFALNVAANLG